MTAKDPITLALRIVQTAARQAGEAADMARELLPLLEAAQRGSGERRVATRDVGEIEYTVERSSERETLVERRLSGKSKPFRCPKAVYEAIAAALAESGRPLSVEDIIVAVEKRLPFRPADFQVRVPLRLWVYRQPPLVVRNRARYAATDPASVHKATSTLWKNISK